MKNLSLDERSRMILHAVINYYIATADPVGSRTLWKKYQLAFSPATIRNIMADLEEMGLLQHPHTSAGRVPTELGYRCYVDGLSHEMQALKQNGRQLSDLSALSGVQGQGREEVFKNICRELSFLSHYIGVVMTPRINNTVFKHVKFIRLRDFHYMVIFVTSNGVVQQHLLEFSDNYNQDELDQMAACLNEHLQDQTLGGARKRLINLMAEEKDEYGRLLRDALALSKEVLTKPDESDLFIEGRINIFDHPEFANVEKMKAIFHAFEEKHQLIKILDKCLAEEGVNIFIGSENENDQMRDCSMVTASYGKYGDMVGALGLIGPIRMRYSYVIPLVEYAAKLLSEILNKG